jgi:hypothetical protein
MAEDDIEGAAALSAALEQAQQRTSSLTVSANAFSSAMARAFSQATVGGKQFDDVLKSLALRLSSLAVTAAFKPIASGITSSLNQLFAGLLGTGGTSGVAAAMGAIKPFATGGATRSSAPKAASSSANAPSVSTSRRRMPPISASISPRWELGIGCSLSLLEFANLAVWTAPAQAQNDVAGAALYDFRRPSTVGYRNLLSSPMSKSRMLFGTGKP